MNTTEASSTARTTFSAIPYFIVGAFVLFAAYIGLMVQQAMRTSVELVSADYYQQELGYQQRMTAQARTAALATPIQLVVEGSSLQIRLPGELAGQPVQGEVRFFRPSDSHLDFTVPLQPDAGLIQTLNLTRLQAGHWRVQLDFAAGARHYFMEQPLER